MEAEGFDPRTSPTKTSQIYLANRYGRVFGRSPPFLALLLFLAKLTPAMPNLVEFCWGKEGGVSYWHNLELGKTILDVFLVDFGSLRPSGANGAGFRAI
jgi:hypothetical protein